MCVASIVIVIRRWLFGKLHNNDDDVAVLRRLTTILLDIWHYNIE